MFVECKNTNLTCKNFFRNNLIDGTDGNYFGAGDSFIRVKKKKNSCFDFQNLFSFYYQFTSLQWCLTQVLLIFSQKGSEMLFKNDKLIFFLN